MQRRDFLTLAASVPFLGLASRGSAATMYTPGAAEAAMDAGQIVLLDKALAVA